MFTANYKQFKTICKSFIILILFCQRRNLYRVPIYKCRLNKCIFHFLFKEFIYDMAKCHAVLYSNIVFFGKAACFFITYLLPEIHASFFFNSICYMESCPFWLKIDLLVVIGNLCCTMYFLGDMSDKVFR